MKTIILAALLALAGISNAYAYVNCTTSCSGNMCSTNCYDSDAGR